MKVFTGENREQSENQQVVPPLKLTSSPVRKTEKTNRISAASLSVSRFGQFDVLETTREQLRESFVLKERKVGFPKVLRGNHEISTGGSFKSITSRR